jgi:hypothetical protein
LKPNARQWLDDALQSARLLERCTSGSLHETSSRITNDGINEFAIWNASTQELDDLIETLGTVLEHHDAAGPERVRPVPCNVGRFAIIV